MTIFSTAFWKGAAERALKTAAQAGAALVTAGGTGLVDLDYAEIGSVVGLAALASLLTSIANPGFVAGAPEEATRGRHARPE